MKLGTYIVTTIVATLALAVVATPAHADKAKPYRYVGIHPIPKAYGGGVCHIQAPHVHVFAPADVKVQYREHDGFEHFVGDPVAYGWDGPRTAYYGHHPIQVDVVVGDDDPQVEYCYLDGPHYHAWAPPPGMKVKLEAGAYWYVGDLPKAYVEARPIYDPIDVVYKPIRYDRPAVVVEAAPPGWYGLVVAAPVVEVHDHGRHGHVHGVVEAGVEVHVPAVRVEIGGPAVIVGGHSHGKFKGKHKGKRGRWR